MADKTLAELRDAVAIRYGDPDLVTISTAEIDLFLEDGYKRVVAKCPWLNTLVQTVTGTTSATGALTLTDPNISQIIRVDVSRNGTYEVLVPMPLKAYNDQYPDTVTAVTSLYGYVLEGSQLLLYPVLASTSVTVRVIYEASSDDNFPSSSGNKLPVTIPQVVDDIIVRYALAEFYTRDGDFDTADRAKMMFNEGIQELTINHNKPQSGQSIQPTNTDFYLLDRDHYSAW